MTYYHVNDKWMTCQTTDLSGCSGKLHAFSTATEKPGEFTDRYHDTAGGDLLRWRGQGGRTGVTLFGDAGARALILSHPEFGARGGHKEFYIKVDGRIVGVTGVQPSRAGAFPWAEDNVPAWLIDPHKTFGMDELCSSGLFVHKEGAKRGIVKDDAKKLAHYKRLDVLPGGFARIRFDGYNYTTRDDVESPTCTPKWWSDEISDANRSTWWWLLAAQRGYGVCDSEDLLGCVADTIINNEDNIKLFITGGNVKPDNAVTSARIVMTAAERCGWRHPLDPEPVYFIHKRRRIYFKPFPFIYVSPQHNSHKCAGGFFSRRPITLECAS